MILFPIQQILASQVFKTEPINIKWSILYITDVYVYT